MTTSEVRADRFRETLRSCYEGRIHSAPLNGASPRAKERKVSGELTISVDEAVRCFRHKDGSNAIPLLRALATDAGIDDRIAIRECAPVPHMPMAEAELDFVAATSQFTAFVDDVRRRGWCLSLEKRRLMELAAGVEARERAILMAAEDGYDGA